MSTRSLVIVTVPTIIVRPGVDLLISDLLCYCLRETRRWAGEVGIGSREKDAGETR